MSYYNKLNEVYMEKIASPHLQYLVNSHRNYVNTRDENFGLKSDNMWTGDAKKMIDKKSPKISVKNGVDTNPNTSPLSQSPLKTTQIPTQQQTTPQNQPTSVNNDSRRGRIQQWIDHKNEVKQAKLEKKRLMQERQEIQRADNQRIENEYKRQQALKNPNFKTAPDPNTQNQSFWSAVKGNKPQGGDKNQAITPSTSVLANPNNQSSLGARMLSWGKSNPGKIAIGTGLIAAGTAAAVYNMNKAKKEKQQKQNQQIQDGMYRTASEELYLLCMEKMASTDVDDIANHIVSDVQDEANNIEKLQESAKYTKKEDVPGGKSAPSRLVQRKNKERFRK